MTIGQQQFQATILRAFDALAQYEPMIRFGRPALVVALSKMTDAQYATLAAILRDLIRELEG